MLNAWLLEFLNNGYIYILSYRVALTVPRKCCTVLQMKNKNSSLSNKTFLIISLCLMYSLFKL